MQLKLQLRGKVFAVGKQPLLHVRIKVWMTILKPVLLTAAGVGYIILYHKTGLINY